MPHGPDGATEWESVHYTALRLAKLGVPLPQVTNAIHLYCDLAHEWRARERRPEVTAALDRLIGRTQPLALSVAQSYVEEQGYAREALLSVLDAELNAHDLDELLQQLLVRASGVFPLRWGMILLADRPDAPLRHRALLGIEPEWVAKGGVGGFFTRVARQGRAGFLLDAANDPRIVQSYFRRLEVRSVWAAPLGTGRRPRPGHVPVTGALVIAFDRVYECLPRERALLLALAHRSGLAIERARLLESLAREHGRVRELSRRLLAAQDEERRRISRDLHDETGQALLALRLYLEMGMRQDPGPAVAEWIQRGLALVDRSVGELRRILAQLSPLGLDELGLEAAVRAELRRQASVSGWQTWVQFELGGSKLSRPTETLVYRVLQEGLSNIARHARARRVRLQVAAQGDELQIVLQDNGVGMPAPTATSSPGERHFGLAGMRERVRLVGGSLTMGSGRRGGVRLELRIPMLTAPSEHPTQHLMTQ